MALFGKRKNDEAFKEQLERDSLEKMNSDFDDDYTLPYDMGESNTFGEMNVKIKAPGVITAEELMGKSENTAKTTPITNNNMGSKSGAQNIPMTTEETSQTSADFLYKRMTESRKQNLEQNSTANSFEKEKDAQVTESNPEPAKAPETVKPAEAEIEPIPTEEIASEPFNLEKAMAELKENFSSEINKSQQNAININREPEIIPFEKTENSEENPTVDEQKSAESPKKIITPEAKNSAEQRRTSLLARCNAYLEDDEFGLPKQDPDKYKLESVENILQDFEARATQKALKNHTANITFVDLSEQKKPDDTESAKSFAPKSEKAPEDDFATKTVDISSSSKPQKAEEVKHYFTADSFKVVAEKKDIGSTASTIILDAAKIGIKPTPTSNATQVFTTLSTSETTPILEEDSLEGACAPEKETEEGFAEYKSIEDKDELLYSLLKSRSRLTLRVIATLFLLIGSLLVTFTFKDSLANSGEGLSHGINLIISLLAICFNFNIIKSLPSLFSKRNDTDLAAAIGSVMATLQTAVCLVVKEDMLPLTSVALLTLLFTNWAKRSQYALVIKNFSLIATPTRKKAISVVTNKTATATMVGNAISGASLVCCDTETANIQDFFKYSYCGDPTANRIKSVTLIGTVAGFVLGFLSMLLTSFNLPFGITVFSAITLIAASPATLFVAHLPFKAAGGRLSYYGAMLTGYKAANELEHCNAIALNCNQLFPEGSIRLIDMKLLSPNPIDQSLLDAEALARNIGSPLAGMFKQINNTTAKAKDLKVDSVVYEDKMGISGWVNDRRVFVGNRVLLEGHGFTNLPPAELDKKIMRKGYFPLYLVSDNVPCAMLVVKYSPDDEIAYELRRLCNTGTTILVSNCDPNISGVMLADYFGLYEDSVAIMSKQGAEQYQIVSEFKEERSSGAAYTDSVCGLLATMTASINVKNSIAIMSAIYVTLGVMGIAAVGVLSLTGATSLITTLPLMLYQLAATIITMLPPFIKRP